MKKGLYYYRDEAGQREGQGARNRDMGEWIELIHANFCFTMHIAINQIH